MDFQAGANSVLDTNAGGWATLQRNYSALYGNYVFENAKWEAELGLRVEYVKIDYKVNPNHNTYTSDGYDYTQPFPNFRLAYKINDHNKLSLFTTAEWTDQTKSTFAFSPSMMMRKLLKSEILHCDHSLQIPLN